MGLGGTNVSRTIMDHKRKNNFLKWKIEIVMWGEVSTEEDGFLLFIVFFRKNRFMVFSAFPRVTSYILHPVFIIFCNAMIALFIVENVHRVAFCQTMMPDDVWKWLEDCEGVRMRIFWGRPIFMALYYFFIKFVLFWLCIKNFIGGFLFFVCY